MPESTERRRSEPEVKKIPKPVIFLITAELFYAIGYYTSGSVLATFLMSKLGFLMNETISVLITASMITLYLSLIGALLADSFGDKLKLLTMVKVCDIVLESLLIIIALPTFRAVGRTILYSKYISHSLVSLSSSGLAGAFAGNQFKLPEERAALVRYFHVSFIIDNVGVLIGFFVGPILKSSFACSGEQDCYALSFGMGFLCLIISLYIFALGFRHYTVINPERNMAFDIFRCLGYGFIHWIRERKTNPKPHWLDHAEPAYGAQLVEDLKRVSRILIIFISIPIYHAACAIIPLKWLFQASRLDNRVGSYNILIEHVQLLNPILTLILMPILAIIFDPVIVRWNMDRIFRRMIFGGLTISAAFVCAGVLESKIMTYSPLMPKFGEAHLRIFNGLGCICNVESGLFNDTIEISAHGVYSNNHAKTYGHQVYKINIFGSCLKSTDAHIYLQSAKSLSVHIFDNDGSPQIVVRPEFTSKSENGSPKLTAVGADLTDSLFLEDSKRVQLYMVHETESIAGHHVMRTGARGIIVIPDTYRLYWKGSMVIEFNLHLGGVYLVMLSGDSANIFTITEPNSVHLAWIIPQSILSTVGEIYYSIALSEFTYNEAPVSLKALVISLNNFFRGFGNSLIVLITNFGKWRQSFEFYFYCFIVLLNIFLLWCLSLRYEPINPEHILI